MPLLLGQVLNDRYRIVKLIGQGGFGAVYRAWDTSLSQPCAVKENLNTSLTAQHQFQREATILAGLRHPNLPRVTDHFLVSGQGQYLVMDFVEGQSLADLLNQCGRPLTEAEALPWLTQVCDALNYLHRQSPPIIHRDIKPQNIIITPAGQAVLVDFGIAKVCDPVMSTLTGAQGVTPGYSPPEQYGAGGTDARSDIYALGATLCKLLTGQTPPNAMDRLAQGVPFAPHSLQPSISSRIEQIIIKAMHIKADARYQTVMEIRQALAGFPVSQSVYVQSGRRIRGYHIWLGVSTIVLLAVLAFLLRPGGLLSTTSIPTPTPTRTVTSTLTATSSPTATWTPSATPTRTMSPTPTFTLTPSATTTRTPTMTPVPQPMFSVSVPTANVRSGPGIAYPKIGELKLGDSYMIVAKNEVGNWWQFVYGGLPGWISSDVISINHGELVPRTPDPPLPTLISTPRSPESRIIFDGDPRNSKGLCETGFLSECNFAGCRDGLRLVYGPYCRNFDSPAITKGNYRVTLHGTGRVRAGATDFGTAGERWRFGQREMDLPGSYGFYWPELRPTEPRGGYGFEIIVESMGYASVSRIMIEYLGE